MELVLDPVLKTPNVGLRMNFPCLRNKWESTDNHEIIPLNSTSNLLFWKKYKFQMREY